MLIELSTAFLSGGRVDDFDGGGASASGGRSEYGCLRLIDDEPMSLVRRRRVDIGIWG
jgi:hypothetical protein